MTLRDQCFSWVWPRQNLRTAQVQLNSTQVRHQLNKNFGLLTFRIPRRINFFALFLSLAGLPWIIFVFLCHLSEWWIYCAENEKNIQELITRSLRESDTSNVPRAPENLPLIGWEKGAIFWANHKQGVHETVITSKLPARQRRWPSRDWFKSYIWLVEKKARVYRNNHKQDVNGKVVTS